MEDRDLQRERDRLQQAAFRGAHRVRVRVVVDRLAWTHQSAASGRLRASRQCCQQGNPARPPGSLPPSPVIVCRDVRDVVYDEPYEPPVGTGSVVRQPRFSEAPARLQTKFISTSPACATECPERTPQAPSRPWHRSSYLRGNRRRPLMIRILRPRRAMTLSYGPGAPAPLPDFALLGRPLTPAIWAFFNSNSCCSLWACASCGSISFSNS